MDEQTLFHLATAVWASAPRTKVLFVDSSLMRMEHPKKLEHYRSGDNPLVSISTASSCARVYGLDLLATAYPDIDTAMLGRPSNNITQKLVALGQATALAACIEEAQRSYAQAKASLDGLHVSIEDFYLAVESDDATTEEYQVSEDERADTSSSRFSPGAPGLQRK